MGLLGKAASRGGAIVWSTGVWLVITLLSVGLSGCSAPEGKITESSKTKKCGKELRNALKAMKKDLGMPYEVRSGDAKNIFSIGGIEKHYARDGVQHTLSFGLDNSDGACRLKLYRKARNEPGRTETSYGDFGSVKLKKCECE